jgi:hypothetical protein
MSFLQSIWSDLVEKRLLPVVAILVIAAIAIPFVITGKKDTSTQLAGPVNTTGEVDSNGQVASSPSIKLVVPVQRHSAGSKRSPFSQPKLAAVTTGAPPSVQQPATPSGGGDNGGGSNPPFVPPSNPPYVPPSTPKAPAGPTDYRVTLRVGQAGDLQVHKDVERLTPLPSTTDPFMVYMGVTDNGKTAVFLLSSDAKATGDGVCHPSATSCETVEMKAGDVEFLDVNTGDAANPVQYELDLTRIVKKASTSGSTSGSGSSTAALNAGAQVVNRSRAAGSPALSGYAFDPQTGALVRRLPTLASQLASIARRSGH